MGNAIGWRDLEGRRRALLVVGLGVALVVGVALLIGKAADYAKLLDSLGQANALWFPVCLAGEALAYAGYIVAYRDVARVAGGPRLDLRTTAHVVAVGFGAFAVGTAAGTLAVDYVALRKAKAPRHEAVARILGLNTLQWAWLALGAMLAAVVLIALGAEVPLAAALPWVAGVPLCFAAAAWVTSPPRRERLARRPRRSGVRAKLRRGFGDAVLGVALARTLVSRPRECPGGLVGFPLFWAGDLLCLYAGLQAFGAEISPAALVLGYATGYVATALPLPAGGAGGVDASLTFALHAVGVPLAPPLLGVFTYRLFNFWLPILPALAALPAIEKLERDLEKVEGGRAKAA